MLWPVKKTRENKETSMASIAQVIPWESDDQEQAIRRWQEDLSWLQDHGYYVFGGTTRYPGITAEQRRFLWKIYCLGSLPTEKELLQQIYNTIQSAPAWLQALEQFISARKRKILVVTTEELLQWKDEQLQEVVKSGMMLYFTE
jgi:hypothetical protein